MTTSSPNPDHDREGALLNAALELPPAERAAFLESACASDATLRQRLEQLLQAHQEAGTFLAEPAAGAIQDASSRAPFDGVGETVILPPVSERPGDRIGRYKLLQQIGEGGCGVVYLAEQQEPVRRQVALKVIKLGMDTRQVIARFEAERQALALMDHPNIAKVLDAGATETGRPYFVMELVRGIKITDYCDQNNLSARERLDLFVQVCRAIQHAHQKGIIHRDIKPSNILVTINDGVPVPKVIDFGIAKATNQLRLTDKTLFTSFAQFIGTPAYMSPEQAVMTSLDIDTRCDIYSLGVLLYELLTGTTPFDAGELLEAGWDEMRRVLREQEPVRPSTRLTKELMAVPRGGTAPRRATPGLAIPTQEEVKAEARRRLRLKEQIHLVRGDLDWVVMKCLEKDRSRRYETAHALAEDIQRYLRHEPVLAAPPSLGYRAGKFWQRHRSRIATTALVALLLLGLVASAGVYRRGVHAQRVRWAKEAAIPEIVSRIQQGDFHTAFTVAQQARPMIPRDPVLADLWSRICREYSIGTTPPGATISCRLYSATNAPWQLLGQSPVTNVILPKGVYRWKIEKEGFQTHECVADRSVEVRLSPADASGQMVWLGPFNADLPAGADDQKPSGRVPAYRIDKHEVTNEEYKKFVEAGAYEKPEFWEGIVFVKEGRPLSAIEAMAGFRDQTGRPGPATWNHGTYPPDESRHPVSGVSWFEAVAYSRFVGKGLPTVYHWEAAACLSESVVIVPLSNFGPSGTAPVGAHPGMGSTGLYDAAGNVKEWCLNATDDSGQAHYILGGGWGEPTYLFTERDSRSPWNRSPQNGIRCVRLPDESESLSSLLTRPIPVRAWRDLSRLVPFSDDEFRMVKSFYEYDHTRLNARIESSDDSSPFWRHEKITFDAAYGKDRVIAHLFLPKTGQPPYQTLVFFPGAGAIYDESFNGLPYQDVVEYFVLSGRALLFPVYYGMYERPAALGRDWTMSSVPQKPLAYRDWTICSVRDLSRSIDYLETRADIDRTKLAYYGLSHGAILGPIMLALENRLHTGILALGCIPPMELPRSFDMALYAQRVTTPVLVVNGREDFLIPVNEGQKPLYELLGSRDKKHSFYDGGHGEFGLFFKQIRQDVMAWLDGHLGAVQAH